jgi:hypothetical protein
MGDGGARASRSIWKLDDKHAQRRGPQRPDMEDTCRCKALEMILQSYLFSRAILQLRFPRRRERYGVLAYLFGFLVPNAAHSRGPSAVGLAKLKVAFR